MSEPFLERIELVHDQGNPSLLLRLDEADLGLLLGRQAAALLDAPPEALRLQRISAQDRIYFLWLDAKRRWVNDPPFRRWMAGAIDREEMLRHLFDGRGAPAYQLLGEEFGGPVWEPRDRAPFSVNTRPRIELVHHGDDPLAASIASRIRAALDLHGVRVDLKPLDRGELHGALRGGAAAALLVHRPRSADPVLGLLESLADLPGQPTEMLDLLRKGATESGADARLGAARGVEATLLRDARLVPLVRIHAWLAEDRDLRGVELGVDGVLRMEGAWWSR
jgi:MarR-like DNA-binding transcriptional regulator SgrR of sgrS sRNA